MDLAARRGTPRLAKVVSFALSASGIALSGNLPAGAAEPPVLVSRAAAGLISETAELGGNTGFDVRTVSNNGRYVVFTSLSGNLVNGAVDQNEDYDVFLRDRDTGATTLVSHTASNPNLTASDFSGNPEISGDGEWVAYRSLATDLVSGQVDSAGGSDLFLWNRVTNTSEIVTHAPGAALTARNSGVPSIRGISDDGSTVLFQSASNSLVVGQVDANGINDFFTFDRAGGLVALVTHAAGAPATAAAGTPGVPFLSANGEWVAYWSNNATNLVAGSTVCSASEAFLYEVATGLNRMISHAPGTPLIGAGVGGCGAGPTSLSADGRYVGFSCAADNCAAGQIDPNGNWDQFLYDRVTDSSALVSRIPASANTTGNNISFFGSQISPDGNWLAFVSSATNLVTGQVDANAGNDLFAWERTTGNIILVTHTAASTTTAASLPTEINWTTGSPLSTDGGVLVYSSPAANLVAGQTDANGGTDVFAWTRGTNSNELVSVSTAGAATTGDAASQEAPAGISADGTLAVFVSDAGDHLVGGVDRNGSIDVFARELGGGPTSAVTTRDVALPAAAVGQIGLGASDFLIESVSGDGRFIAFTSPGGNLTAGVIDRNDASDVFLYDRGNGAVTLISHVAGNLARTANNRSLDPRISEDGNWVAFDSFATNTVAGVTDTNNLRDAFLWERATGAITLISHANGLPLTTANADSGFGSMSADGSRISYHSFATNLVAGQSDGVGTEDAFLYDRGANTSVLVSRSAASATTAVGGYPWQITLDGAWVAFQSTATNVVTGQTDANAANDVFLFERATSTNRLVSRSSAGVTAAGNGSSVQPQVSRDGRYVSFVSQATNLVTGQSDVNGLGDVFLFDRLAGTTQLVSSTGAGSTTTGNGRSDQHGLSSDGRYVALRTTATNLLAGVTDPGSGGDLYRWDRFDGSRRLVSRLAVAPLTAAEGVGEDEPTISTNGEWILFASAATGLVSGVSDSNGNEDIFLWSAGSGSLDLISRTPGSATTTGNGRSGFQHLSLQGGVALFASDASNLASDDNNQYSDLFATRLQTLFSDDFELGTTGAWDLP